MGSAGISIANHHLVCGREVSNRAVGQGNGSEVEPVVPQTWRNDMSGASYPSGSSLVGATGARVLVCGALVYLVEVISTLRQWRKPPERKSPRRLPRALKATFDRISLGMQVAIIWRGRCQVRLRWRAARPLTFLSSSHSPYTARPS